LWRRGFVSPAAYSRRRRRRRRRVQLDIQQQ